ncbi:MAG: hypothetical protein WCJ29_06030 [bacterium]
MTLGDVAELHRLIKDAQNVLVITKTGATPDDVAAVLALRRYLIAESKPNSAVIPDFDAKTYPEAAALGVTPKMTRMRQFVISVDLAKTELDSSILENRDGKLRLRLSPQEGLFSKSDIEVGHSDWRFDLVITAGAPIIESIGKSYDLYKDFFLNTKIIAIHCDSKPSPGATLSISDEEATSVHEITKSLLLY